MTSFHASLVVACIVAVSFVGCASPPPGSRDAGASGPSAGPGPRFAAGGPDAREYGADADYPIGDQSTYFSLPFLVGSRSHLDQVFEGRIVRRASTPSPLGRAAAEPIIRYEHDGQTLTLDDYLARHPTTGLLIAGATRSSSSATSTRGTIGIASRRGRWPRPSPRC